MSHGESCQVSSSNNSLVLPKLRFQWIQHDFYDPVFVFCAQSGGFKPSQSYFASLGIIIAENSGLSSEVRPKIMPTIPSWMGYRFHRSKIAGSPKNNKIDVKGPAPQNLEPSETPRSLEKILNTWDISNNMDLERRLENHGESIAGENSNFGNQTRPEPLPKVLSQAGKPQTWDGATSATCTMPWNCH